MLITLQITVNLLFLKSTKHNEQACHVAINNGSVQLRNRARVFLGVWKFTSRICDWQI